MTELGDKWSGRKYWSNEGYNPDERHMYHQLSNTTNKRDRQNQPDSIRDKIYDREITVKDSY